MSFLMFSCQWSSRSTELQFLSAHSSPHKIYVESSRTILCLPQMPFIGSIQHRDCMMTFDFVDNSLQEVICEFPFDCAPAPEDLVAWLHAPNKNKEAKIFCTSVHSCCAHIFSRSALEADEDGSPLSAETWKTQMQGSWQASDVANVPSGTQQRSDNSAWEWMEKRRNGENWSMTMAGHASMSFVVMTLKFLAKEDTIQCFLVPLLSDHQFQGSAQHSLHVPNPTQLVHSHCEGSVPRVHCTALKATGLLSCLQMKIVSFRMKLKW